MTTEFKPFPKMARLSREVIITEKIDGTNAQVFISLESILPEHDMTAMAYRKDGELYHVMRAGSRSRWLTRESDNFGFAKWVSENSTELWSLGQGSHFGEWWGSGVQRGYGLKEKRFSLFNTGRWIDSRNTNPVELGMGKETAPACCHVVPILSRGPFSLDEADLCLRFLRDTGSQASPGFMNPEGIVVFHTAANFYFKKTIKDDDKPKSA